jgi:hypothetical protein
MLKGPVHLGHKFKTDTILDAKTMGCKIASGNKKTNIVTISNIIYVIVMKKIENIKIIKSGIGNFTMASIGQQTHLGKNKTGIKK